MAHKRKGRRIVFAISKTTIEIGRLRVVPAVAIVVEIDAFEVRIGAVCIQILPIRGRFNFPVIALR